MIKLITKSIAERTFNPERGIIYIVDQDGNLEDIKKEKKLIKNDVLVEFPGYIFWFSDFKSLMPDYKTVNLTLKDNILIGFEPKENQTLEQLFDKCNKIIVTADIEYRKRNLDL